MLPGSQCSMEMIGDERFLSKDGLLRTTLPSLRLASSLRRFVAKGRSTSSPTLGPLGPTITLKPYSAEAWIGPNRSGGRSDGGGFQRRQVRGMLGQEPSRNRFKGVEQPWPRRT